MLSAALIRSVTTCCRPNPANPTARMLWSPWDRAWRLVIPCCCALSDLSAAACSLRCIFSANAAVRSRIAIIWALLLSASCSLLLEDFCTSSDIRCSARALSVIRFSRSFWWIAETLEAERFSASSILCRLVSLATLTLESASSLIFASSFSDFSEIFWMSSLILLVYVLRLSSNWETSCSLAAEDLASTVSCLLASFSAIVLRFSASLFRTSVVYVSCFSFARARDWSAAFCLSAMAICFSAALSSWRVSTENETGEEAFFSAFSIITISLSRPRRVSWIPFSSTTTPRREIASVIFLS